MKTYFYFMLFVFLVGILFLPCQQARAQSAEDTTNVTVGDTMYVAWAQTGWTARINALRSAIYGDTASDGSRANLNRVYKLKTNGWYWESDDIKNTGYPLRLVADPTTAIGAGNYPPVLQMTDTRVDGTTAERHLITAGDDVEMRGIFVSGRTTVNGAQDPYQPILFAQDDSRYIIDDCIFEHSNFSLVVFTGKRCVGYVTNNKFRNLEEFPVTQQWTGRGVSIWTDVDTVVMENNTFFNMGFMTFQMENGSAKYLRYNHNTIVNCGRGLSSNSGNWWQEAYFANNLVINGWWEGEGYGDTHASGRDARMIYSGLYNVAALPSSYGIETSRRIVFTKTYAYLDPNIISLYGDTIARARFIDPVSKEDYLTPYAVGGPNDGHMYCADTVWLTSLPAGMTYYLTDNTWQQPKYMVTGATMLDSMWAFINQIRAGTGMSTTFFYHPTLAPSDETWPLPEDFSYTEPSLLTAGTDGLPIGDLNWFPTQKATFEANKAQYIAQIQNLAGAVTIVTIEDKIEAEDGSIAGSASINTVSGFIYWNYNQVGQLTWTFDVPTGKAGYYSTKWLVNLDDQSGSQGMVMDINSTQINDKVYGWGATPYSHDVDIGAGKGPTTGLDYGWVWVTADSVEWKDAETFNLAEGTNTIGVMGGGWNRLLFAEIDLAPMGSVIDDTIRCLGAEAVASGGDIEFGAVGIPWVPSKFKSVDFGAGGTDTITVTALMNSTYKLRLFGQNLSGSDQIVTVLSEAGTTLGTASIPFVTDDSSGNDALTTAFTLSPGAQKLVLSGSDVKIDYIQLLSFVGVNEISPLKPNEFALSQNYPNPFNPSTKIEFTLSRAAKVRLTVFNILGQKVATLVDGYQNAGLNTVVFDASRFASGVYFYRLESGRNSVSKKMMLIK